MVTFYGSISDETLKPYYRAGQMSSYQLEMLDETDESCRYKIIIKTKSGKMHEDTIDLVKEDDEWKVSNF